MAVWGVILAGGLARRMGGGDKALLPLAGRPLLAHAIARLRPQLAGLVLNANGDPARFAGFGLPVVADTLPGHPGPLAGVLAGLDWLAAHVPGCKAAVTLPADTPFPPADLVARLCAAGPLSMAASDGRAHPVVALWPVSARTALRQALDAGERRVGAVMAGAARVEWPIEPYDPFLNLNTPGDLAMAERLAATLAG